MIYIWFVCYSKTYKPICCPSLIFSRILLFLFGGNTAITEVIEYKSNYPDDLLVCTIIPYY